MIFAYHGHPWLIHRLTYRRTNHDNIVIRSYKEQGTTTTPFDMTGFNDLDTFYLAGDLIYRVSGLSTIGTHAKQDFRGKLIDHRAYVNEYGGDLPKIKNWK